MFSEIKCSFFGHRKINQSEELKQRLTNVVEDLIVNHNVFTFLFGSRSDFDDLCHEIVTSLKETYPFIKKICYTSKSEGCYLEEKRKEWEEFYSRIEKRQVILFCYDEEFEHKTKYTAGKASYVERNQAMINDSDYCIFYYNKNYLPPKRSYSKRSISQYQPKSGTALAYKYAMQKKKNIINVFN